ncbi:MAG: hypothetical protein RJB15_1812, partial [Pseudomonadota bacterium]
MLLKTEYRHPLHLMMQRLKRLEQTVQP